MAAPPFVGQYPIPPVIQSSEGDRRNPQRNHKRQTMSSASRTILGDILELPCMRSD